MKANKFKLTKSLEVAAIRWQYQRRALPEAKQFADEATPDRAADPTPTVPDSEVV